MVERVTKRWTPAEKAQLVVAALIDRHRVCIRFAELKHRSPSSVRVMLCRLEKEEINRPPSGAAESLRAHLRNRDAAAPRVTTACGPSGTSDKH